MWLNTVHRKQPAIRPADGGSPGYPGCPRREPQPFRAGTQIDFLAYTAPDSAPFCAYGHSLPPSGRLARYIRTLEYDLLILRAPSAHFFRHTRARLLRNSAGASWRVDGSSRLRRSLAALRESYFWVEAIEPMVNFVQARRHVSRACGGSNRVLRLLSETTAPRPTTVDVTWCCTHHAHLGYR